MELRVERIDELVDPEEAFVALYGDSEKAFWLDSSRVGEGARFSFMGDDGGPSGATVTYEVGLGEVKVERGGEVELRGESIFEYLAREVTRCSEALGSDPAVRKLPFEFACGFAGWLGYELKAECGGELAHESDLPDAAFVFADRMLAFDHAERCTYLLCLAEPGEEREGDEWLAATGEALVALTSRAPSLRIGSERRPDVTVGGDDAAELRLAR